jgi:DNA-binding SARP family transcriptional activator
MDFRILGRLEVLEGDRAVTLAGSKQRALLALLVLHANETVSADRLIDELWGEVPPATAAKTLQVHISRLRKALEGSPEDGSAGVVVTREGGYELRADPDSVDSCRFERLVIEGRGELFARRPERAAPALEAALSMWRGPPLAEFAGQHFARAEIARLEDLRVAALEELMEAKLALGRHGEVVGALEPLIAEHPYRERLRAQLMLALYRCDRQAHALQAYQDARRTLVEELGIEPGERLRGLERAILDQDPKLGFRPGNHTETGAPPDAPRGAFVGREGELAELIGGLDDALAGRGRLFLLVGEPGIGKSRLAEELIVNARARGAWILVGRCWEGGGAPAYWPWVQSLRAYVRECDAASLRAQLAAGAADLAQIVPELRERFPDLPHPLSPESEGARFRLFDSTVEFLRNASAQRPIVLVLDDLHAADASSLLLLRFLARELGSTRILLLGAYRNLDPIPGQSLTETLAEVTREPVTRRLWLGGLSAQDVAAYVELTASEIASSELVAALHEETEGNPLFLGETVRLLSAEGVHSEPTLEDRLAIPQSVRDVIARRLTHLSEECNRVLVLASVIGREFALDALARAAAVSQDELLDTLDEAMAARIVSDVPGGPGRLRFAHVVIRDTLYDGLTTARRVRLHRLAVDTCEELYGQEPGPHLAALAHHAIAGSDFDKGLRYAWRAADRALALLAYEEAARLYQTALDALALSAPADGGKRCELLLALGNAQMRGGDLAAKETFTRAAEVARMLNAPEQLARAALGYGGTFVWFRAGKDQRLIPLLEDALEALPELSPLRARLLARLAGALRGHPEPERRASLSREAVDVARRLGDPATLAYALEGTYAALSWPKDTDSWLAMARELIELADDVGDEEQAYMGHLHTWCAFMVRGDLPAAQTEFATATAIARGLRQPAQLWSQTTAEATLALFAGRFEEAERLIAQVQLGPARHGALGGVDDTTFHYVANLQSWALRRERGGLADVREPIERYVAEYPTFFIFRCILANLYSQLGRQADARHELDRLAADDFAALEVGTEWHFGTNLLAEVCAALGDGRYAARLYEALSPYGDCIVMALPEFSLGSASRYLGLLAHTMSRWDDAALYFNHALKINASMGALPWVAHTQHDYARMLLARDNAGDKRLALHMIAQARKAYNELGMQSWAKKASSVERALRDTDAPGH